MELIDGLSEIGLTEYEAKVYLALLQEHPASGYRISQGSGVPRSMVYQALGRLEAKGFVMKATGERATLYRPLPPEVLLEGVQQDHLERMRLLSRGLEKLYAARQEDRLWNIAGLSSVLAYAREMIRSAEEELMLVLADRELEALQADIIDAHGRGVLLSTLLTGLSEFPYGEVARHPPLESELQEITGNLVVVVDRREALIASGDDEPSASVTNIHDIVLFARQFIWMELFAQRIYARLGSDLLKRLDADDQRVFEGFTPIQVSTEE
jgi:Cd2+/Zn2+-exporting ATPase